jgi:hypothetical protein
MQAEEDADVEIVESQERMDRVELVQVGTGEDATEERTRKQPDCVESALLSHRV